ncbi:MAG: hydantoinase/oxoprolinase family protein [Gemmataceae bacterium]
MSRKFPIVSVLGLDIGGANLKAAHVDGAARSLPFALWRHPEGLREALDRLLAEMPPFDMLAVTMTGELCDCFETKRQGVGYILDTVARLSAGKAVRVWQNEGRFTDVATARANPFRTASANWLALATFAGRFAPAGPALLLDIGSTTTDIIPLRDGQPIPTGRTDLERLASGELLYTGARRTPVCALLGTAGAAEWFATTLDVYLLLEDIAEDAADQDTADGRPATRCHAHDRLARMLCADRESLDCAAVRQLAERIAAQQLNDIAKACQRVAERGSAPPETLIFSGSGEFLAHRLLALGALARPKQVISWRERLGVEISSAACAYAVAVLACA